MRIPMLGLLFSVTCGLSDIARAQPQSAVQNSGNTNTKQLNNIQGYEARTYSQEQYQQDVNQPNAEYAYQDDQLQNTQVYQNSVNQQPAQVYPQPASTQYYVEHHYHYDTVPAQSRFSSMMSKITEFIMAFFNSEGTARNEPGFAAILSLSSFIIDALLYTSIIGSILYI